jgi:glyoxylase-like metal-dependent hydrolase (beta-lactamase superfamily II)
VVVVEFLTLDLESFTYGAAQPVAPLVRRVIAENPSKFTYFGTGTYIVGGDANGHGDVVVIDPGPELGSHREALATAIAGERVRAILVTHCHADHSPLAAWLRVESGAPTIAFGPHPLPTPGTEPAEPPDGGGGDDVEIEESTDYDFAPDVVAADGDVVVEGDGVTMTAVHTPGHTSNHMCWSLAEERALFTGDHVMGWSTTVVSPPDGDMTAYLDSLRRVASRNDAMLWPTHGPPRDDAATYVQALIEHRLERERGVLEAVRSGRSTIADIVTLLYAEVRVELHKPAGRSVWAHLERLVAQGRVEVEGAGEPALDSHYSAV